MIVPIVCTLFVTTGTIRTIIWKQGFRVPLREIKGNAFPKILRGKQGGVPWEMRKWPVQNSSLPYCASLHASEECCIKTIVIKPSFVRQTADKNDK